MVKVQLFWQPTTERPWGKYNLSWFHTDTDQVFWGYHFLSLIGG